MDKSGLSSSSMSYFMDSSAHIPFHPCSFWCCV